MGSENLFASKNARKFYSQKLKTFTKYTHHSSLETSQNLTTVLKINETEENRYNGTPIKRKYKSANRCSKRRYKSTGDYIKYGQVPSNDNNSIESSDTNLLPCADHSDSETSISIHDNSTLLETSPQKSNTSQYTLCSPVSTQQIPTPGSSCRNIYHHDKIFWTTNFYGKKAQKLSSPKSSIPNTKNENSKSNLNTSKCIPTISSCSEIKNSVISSASCQDVNDNKEAEFTPKKKLCEGASRISKDKPCINSNISSENMCKSEEPLHEASLEAINASFSSNDDLVTARSGLSTPRSIPSTPKLHRIVCTSTPLQSPLEWHDNESIVGAISPCNKTPASTPQLPSKENSNGEVSKSELNSSLSSMDLSFTSSNINTSMEDELSEKVNDVICKLVISPGSAKREVKNKSDNKKIKKVENVNTILNYFTKSITHEKKTVKCECDKTNVGEVAVKKKKKGVLTVSPMFDLPISPRLNSNCKRGTIHSRMKDRKSVKNNKMEQMYIDIGQKNFGHVKCPTCGMIYTECQEEDEAQHASFHHKIIAKLHFKGWKDEKIVQEFPDGRIIKIENDDHPSHLKKLAEVKEVVDAELGFNGIQNSYPKAEQQAFLFIMAKKVIGCAIAININKAYPVIPHSNSKSSVSENSSPSAAWCCSAEPVVAQCGVSRVWVLSHNRRQKIASRLVDCIRFNFLYGCVIPKEKIAFSDPTPNGRSFAEEYTGTSSILVFR